MYATAVRDDIASEIRSLREAGLYKDERVLVTPQGARVRVRGGAEVLNFCANNYLGLSSHPRIVAAARKALEEHGYGLSSVRFICGTQELHKDLERAIAEFLAMEDAILYSSCWDANGGLFEILLGEQDAVVSDALNHASIIDGVRLCKAQRHRYANADPGDLEARLKEARAAGARRVLIATDGVFSMDGNVAPLREICDLAERHDALVHVDDSHATGFLGETGRGTIEQCGVMGRVDIVTSTLGKALGGASGGFTASRAEVVELLRNRSRPYLFSNTIPPPIAGAAREALRMLSTAGDLVAKLKRNTAHFRERIAAAGFEIKPGVTPIVPIMLYQERLAHDLARDLLQEGVYVVGFSYPVVPKGQARIRVQISAAHETEQLDRAVEAFAKVGKRHGVVR
ncbi:MAG: glycine C-acetyltransferase [Planctomycetota bacterium]